MKYPQEFYPWKLTKYISDVQKIQSQKLHFREIKQTTNMLVLKILGHTVLLHCLTNAACMGSLNVFMYCAARNFHI